MKRGADSVSANLEQHHGCSGIQRENAHLGSGKLCRSMAGAEMRRISIVVFTIALLLGQAGSAQAAPLFTQVESFPGGWSSQNTPNPPGLDCMALDDFALGQSASITGVQWQGAYHSNYYADPSKGTITQFQITFWSNNNGLPGSVLETYVIAGNAGEQLVASGSGFLDYSYGASLAKPFLAAAHTIYWLSIQPTADYPPQWLWRSASGGDGLLAVINQAVSDTPQIASDDLAFTLSGTEVPEPSTLALATAMLIALSGRCVSGKERMRQVN
jgi:hypothetical protein